MHDPMKYFWSRFGQFETEMFRELSLNYLSQLSEELDRVGDDLVFEIGPIVDGKRDFVIGAHGLWPSFPLVEALTAAAPDLVLAAAQNCTEVGVNP